MASVTVFTCPGGSTGVRTATLSTEQYPTCISGEGVWTQVELAEPFDPSSLNSAELGGAFGAGFIVMGTGLAIVWAAKQVIRAVRGALT